MGNYRFRISDMMPNAWFYKLKDMGSRGAKKQGLSHSTKRGYPLRGGGGGAPATPKSCAPPSPPPRQAFLPSRASYHFSSRAEAEKFGKFSHSPIHPKASDTHLPIDPPRKSKRRSRRNPPVKPPTKLVTSSVSAGCPCRAWEPETLHDFSEAAALDHWNKHTESDDYGPCKPIIADRLQFDGIAAAWPTGSCGCRLTSSASDIIIDVGAKNSIARKLERLEKDLDEVPELELRPILTKPAKNEAEVAKCEDGIAAAKPESYRHNSAAVREQSKSQAKRSPPGLHRLRMRANSPRIASRRVQTPRARKSFGLPPTASTKAAQERKGLSDSFAVVKSSSDPQRDFRDSMVEMIVENNIRTSKDLEELLACYLSLNSNEYHDVIVKVFEQIWFDLTDIRL